MSLYLAGHKLLTDTITHPPFGRTCLRSYSYTTTVGYGFYHHLTNESLDKLYSCAQVQPTDEDDPRMRMEHIWEKAPPSVPGKGLERWVVLLSGRYRSVSGYAGGSSQ